jgi:N12 class adenine-specific DNA methylase
MLKTNGGGICDHEVGAGKTLIMCTAAYEMKRLGLANKPMIIGLKANVFDIADTFRKAYPNARILYPGKNDFSKQNRQRIFNDIKNNDWDCIILTHEQFGMITAGTGDTGGYPAEGDGLRGGEPRSPAYAGSGHLPWYAQRLGEAQADT